MEPIGAASVPPRGRTTAWRVVVVVVTVAAIAFLALALREGLDEAEGSVVPPAGWIAVSGALAIPSVVAAAHSWVVLLPAGVDRKQLLRSFYATQLWRHLPIGGAAQVAGQIALAHRTGVPAATAALASPVSLLMLLVAAATLGATSVLTGVHVVRFVPVLIVVGVASLALLRRATLARFLVAARRWVPRVPDVEHLPSQAALVRAFLLGGGALVVHGIMLTLLLRSSTNVSPIAIVAANAVAWATGVLAVPAPSGLGVREGALVALLGGSVPTAVLVGAALIQRLVLIVAELVTVAAVTGLAPLVRRARAGR